MTAAPAATFSVRDPRLGSRAGCGCCWRSWSSPPPRPGLAQVNEGFGPGTPRWPPVAPRAPARAQAAPARDAAARAPGSQRSEGAAAGLGARGSGPAVLLQAPCGLCARMQARPRGAAQGRFFARSPPPPLTLSAVSGPACAPRSVLGRCPSRGGSVLVATLGSDQGQQTGCRAALASPLSSLIPCPREAASTLHLQCRVWSLAGGIRRPKVLAKPVFLARVIFV